MQVPRSGTAESYGDCIFLVGELTLISTPALSHIPSSAGGSRLQALANSYLCPLRHPAVCAVVPHCGFHLHFPNDRQHKASSYVFFGHLCISGQMFIQILRPFLNWVLPVEL